jgi:two-component system chemotaxis response regulator CheB
VPAPGKLRSKLKAQPKGKIRAIAIASSTGGPPALAELLKPLPKDLPFPILIAQHIAPGFMAGLLRWIQTQTVLTLRQASGGEIPAAGEVWMPRDGADLQWGPDHRLRVTQNAGGVCPNADLLLLSLAHNLGPESVGAVLTGMGQDGAEGLWAMKQAGALTFAQDAASCVVDGMPSAAVARGGASQRLTPQEIGFCLAELANGNKEGN